MTPQALTGATFGVGILSSVIGGLGHYEEGQEQRSAYDYNADITLQNMRARMVSNQQGYTNLVGKQASGYAAAGVDIASGSPLLIMAATAARGAQQNKIIEEQGTDEANLERYYGKVAAWSGTMSGIGSFLQGVSSSATAYKLATLNPTPTPSPWSSSTDGTQVS